MSSRSATRVGKLTKMSVGGTGNLFVCAVVEG